MLIHLLGLGFANNNREATPPGSPGNVTFIWALFDTVPRR